MFRRFSAAPVLKTNASATAGKGITTAAKVSAAIPVRAFEGMSVSNVMTFLRRPFGKQSAITNAARFDRLGGRSWRSSL
jgi:hypothetical protein